MIKIIKKESENNRKGILHNILLYCSIIILEFSVK